MAKKPIISPQEKEKINAGRGKQFAEGRDAAAAKAGEGQRVAQMKSANPAPQTPKMIPQTSSGGGSGNALVPRGGATPPNQLATRPSGGLSANSPRIPNMPSKGYKFSPTQKRGIGAAVGLAGSYAKNKLQEAEPSSVAGQAAQGMGITGAGAMEGFGAGSQFGPIGAGVGTLVGATTAVPMHLLNKEGDRRVGNIQHEDRRKALEGHFARARDPLNTADRQARIKANDERLAAQNPNYSAPRSDLQMGPAYEASTADGSTNYEQEAKDYAQKNAGQAPAGQAPAGQAPAGQAPAASAQGQADQFRRYHGTAFDPNSKLDRQKMKAMQGVGVKMDKSGMGPQAPATRKTLTAANMYDNPNRKYSGGR